VKTLELEFDASQPNDWRRYLSELIDLSTLTSLKVSGAWIRSAQRDLLDDLTLFCRQTSSLTSLKICYDHFYRRANFTGEQICGLVPRSVRDLSISLKNADQIPLVLERLPHLSTAHFYFDYTRSWQRLTCWLQSNREDATFQASSSSLSVWLTADNESNVKINPKRIKLTDEKEQQQRQK
jgi:radical SAM superfamily enzyme with C-terminal helix-hairpin-helix motif